MSPSRKPLLALLAFSLLAQTSRIYAVSPAEQAQQAWENRDKPGQTEQAIAFWQEAIKADPTKGELWIAVTKACGRAVRHAKNASDKSRWADQARESGEKAVALSPSSSQAYAVYAEALGQWANVHKGIHSLKMVRQAVEALKKAIALDPKNSYAHMLLASFYREAPSTISVGDKQKALEHARLAVQEGPQYAVNHLVLAKVLIDLGKKEEGAAQLQQIIALAPPHDAIPETHADQETAAAMLQDLNVAPTKKAESQTPGTSSCGDSGGVCTDQPHS